MMELFWVLPPGVHNNQLNLGMTNESYGEFYLLVDYGSVWDPVEVQEAYKSFAAHADGFFVAAYPSPLIPDEFDEQFDYGNTFVNAGLNLKSAKQPSQQFDTSNTKSVKRAGSPLFMWMVILIVVTPLLLTTIVIAAVIISSVSREFNEIVNDAVLYFVDVEIYSLVLYLQLRADFVATSTSRSVWDLYTMTRYSGWLLFDGIEKSG
jgi:hypothetical protein